jgi:hypothetical protein
VSTVTDFLPRLAGTYAALVEHLERMPPRYVDRARTALKGLIGEGTASDSPCSSIPAAGLGESGGQPIHGGASYERAFTFPREFLHNSRQ